MIKATAHLLFPQIWLLCGVCVQTPLPRTYQLSTPLQLHPVLVYVQCMMGRLRSVPACVLMMLHATLASCCHPNTEHCSSPWAGIHAEGCCAGLCTAGYSIFFQEVRCTFLVLCRAWIPAKHTPCQSAVQIIVFSLHTPTAMPLSSSCNLICMRIRLS